jgi:alpha-glucosidase
MILALAGTGAAQAGAPGPVAVTSPNGLLKLAFTHQHGQLKYEVTYRGRPVIQPSNLGLEFAGQAAVLGANMRIVSSRRGSVDQSYRVVHGKSNPVRDRHNWVRMESEEADGLKRRFAVEGRAYDDGVAFRYLVPKQPAIEEFRLKDEKTEFRLTGDHLSYPLILRSFRTNYEAEHQSMRLSSLPPAAIVGLPFLWEVPDTGWFALTEAHLENYSGMYVSLGKAASVLEARLAPRDDQPELKVIAPTPHQSPWRVLMAAAEPARLIESNLIANLNPPCALPDTTWIRPGKVTWPWWSNRAVTGVNFEGGVNTPTKKYFIDFAAKAGLEYLIVDTGWYASGRSPDADITKGNPQLDIQEVLRYAKAKGVKVWLWLNWAPADRQMDKVFPLYRDWGVVGVKIDHMNRDDQWMVDFYHRLARKAAENRLMVDFHGAYKPTGMSRTYPNVITTEGVMGLEDVKWDARANPANDLRLPFTRMLAGPMDYTPGGFDNVTREQFVSRRTRPMVLGTRTHQLALYVVFESPLQMVSDHPGAYEGAAEFKFIRDVPTNWDETRVINARVEEYVTIARRSGEDWYLGSITNWTARELEIPLRFLKNGKYIAEIYADAEDADRNPKRVIVETKTVDRGAKLVARLATGGGYAVRLRRAK